MIFDNHVYLTAYTGYGIDKESPGDPTNLVRHLPCIDIDDGKTVWQKSVPAQSDKNEFTTWGVALHGYASSTPTVDNTGIYIFFGETGVLAFDHSGTELWGTNCGAGTTVLAVLPCNDRVEVFARFLSFSYSTGPFSHTDFGHCIPTRNRLPCRDTTAHGRKRISSTRRPLSMSTTRNIGPACSGENL